MRVLYVIDSLVGGGAENSLLAMAPHLAGNGIDLEIAYLSDRPGLQDRFRAAGTAITAVPAKNRAQRVQALRRLMKGRQPDLVHTTLFEADVAGRIAARSLRIPTVTSLVNASYGPEHYSDPNIARSRLRAAQMLDAGTARLAARFHAITNNVADVMARRLHIDRSLMDVIPRGRDPRSLGTRDPARRAAVRSLLGVPIDRPLIVAAARHEHQKGLDILIRAMPRVLEAAPGARLVVAGRPGNASATLAGLVRDLGLEELVSLLGTRQDVPDIICAGDVFVLPSRWEGFAGVLLEAMAVGTPVVASGLAPVREVLPDGHALLVPSNDASTLADAILRTLKHPEAGAERAERARERFLSVFDVAAVTDRMTDFYANVLGSADVPSLAH